MNPRPRRGVLAATFVAPAVLAADPAVAATADAPLIALCDTMSDVLRDLSATPADLDDTSPEWRPYDRIADAMCAARPETMEGIMAMARATMAHARDGGGADDDEPDGVVAVWAWAIVRHLLRVGGAT
ncbi:hypothetical protein AAFN86_28200 [Roseomonas sp. CAU 1739]|uniref:hypothetical protein n=1 Tax=Roseomonas sp. CAU 1739 TaxID=3140364 RepID=UPI00325AF720